MTLHPAEQRGYRELFLSAREAEGRLGRLGEALRNGAAEPAAKAEEALREMVAELEPQAQAADPGHELERPVEGARIGTVRSEILDPLLERNQALRFAVDDLEHVSTLLAYLAAAGKERGDEELSGSCLRWERRLRRHIGPVRNAAVGLGAEPDAAIEPLDPGASAAVQAATAGGGAAPISEPAGPLKRLGLRR